MVGASVTVVGEWVTSHSEAVVFNKFSDKAYCLLLKFTLMY